MYRFLIVLLFVVSSSASQAAVIYNMSGGKLSSIQNIDISGTLYDVTFQNGSFNTIFGSDANLMFTSSTQAYAAAEALRLHLVDGVVASDGFTYNYDTNNSLVEGCVNYIWCDMLTPYMEFIDASGTEKAASFATRNFYDTTSDYSFAVTLGSDFNTDNPTVPFWYTCADWRLASQVPEPASAILMSMGLLGVGYVSRKRKSG